MNYNFQLPSVESKHSDKFTSTFKIEPLDQGFGYTFGAALRRIMLSSLSGTAVTSIQIQGAAHEFSSLPGVREDVTDIVLNIKEIIFKAEQEVDGQSAVVKVKGPGQVTAGDLQLPAGVEVLNPELVLANLDDKGKLEAELWLESGRGFTLAPDNKKDDKPIGVIPVDALYSPIKRVAYEVEAARVGQRTDYDALVLEVETNGSITPQQAIEEAAEILIQSASIFTSIEKLEALRQPVIQQVDHQPEAPAENPLDSVAVEELELGVRAYNCLKSANINTVGELLQKTEAELQAIPNFGKKSIDEVLEAVAGRGLKLRD